MKLVICCKSPAKKKKNKLQLSRLQAIDFAPPFISINANSSPPNQLLPGVIPSLSYLRHIPPSPCVRQHHHHHHHISLCANGKLFPRRGCCRSKSGQLRIISHNDALNRCPRARSVALYNFIYIKCVSTESTSQYTPSSMQSAPGCKRNRGHSRHLGCTTSLVCDRRKINQVVFKPTVETD